MSLLLSQVPSKYFIVMEDVWRVSNDNLSKKMVHLMADTWQAAETFGKKAGVVLEDSWAVVENFSVTFVSGGISSLIMMYRRIVGRR
jgi:hypothetical protein